MIVGNKELIIFDPDGLEIRKMDDFYSVIVIKNGERFFLKSFRKKEEAESELYKWSLKAKK